MVLMLQHFNKNTKDIYSKKQIADIINEEGTIHRDCDGGSISETGSAGAAVSISTQRCAMKIRLIEHL